jgi:hypothetical protein
MTPSFAAAAFEKLAEARGLQLIELSELRRRRESELVHTRASAHARYTVQHFSARDAWRALLGWFSTAESAAQGDDTLSQQAGNSKHGRPRLMTCEHGSRTQTWHHQAGVGTAANPGQDEIAAISTALSAANAGWKRG